MRIRRALTVVPLALGLCGVAACSGGDDREGGAATEIGPEGTAPPGSDSGPCPQNLIIQTDWFPEIEHGGTYQLIGAGGTIDKDGLTYAGPLRNRYKGAHGVQTVEIRAGGAAVDNQSVTSLMYGAGDELVLGFVNTDDAIAASAADEPVVGVLGSLEISPQMLMWSPARFAITDFTDLGASRAPVLHFPGMAYIDYLVSEGYITADQPDATYGGDPQRWLDSGGDVIQQGFATNEVFTYTNLLEGWKRPVDFFLIHWMGYENYPAMLSIRADQLEAQSDCLRELVPSLQKAWVDFLAAPGPVSDQLVVISDTFDTFFKISPELNERAVEMFTQFELATNGADDVYGNFDPSRVGRLFEILRNVYAKRGTPLPESLKPGDVFTNDFVDPDIGIGRTTG